MKKLLLPVLLLAVLVSCKEDAVVIDPCRVIKIHVTIINQTDTDLYFQITTSDGCRVEANPGGELYFDIDSKAGQTEQGYGGTYGVKQFRIILSEADEFNITGIEGDITEDDQEITVLVTFDGTEYKMEFI